MNRFGISCLLTIAPLLAMAQESSKPTNQSGFMKALYWVKNLIDSSAVKGVDRSYIEQPKRPWAVEVRTDASDSNLKMNTDLDFGDGVKGTMTTISEKGFTTSLGAWVGYRGYGLGWSKELSGGEGTSFSLGFASGRFGINFRLTSYHSNMPEFLYTFTENGQNYKERDYNEIDDPIKVRTVFLDAYYLFNGKHFSYAAAYDQSLIQRRSAGSLMVGVMYDHTSADYSASSNWGWVWDMNGVGRMKFTQANIGLGYAYNWVPARGWLISVLAMPTLTVYNRTTLYHYSFGFYTDKETFEEAWEEALENPEKAPLLDTYNVSTTSNKITLNYDARMSVVYNWQRTYLRVYGHYNRFHYGSGHTWGRLYDWKVYAAFGYRF